MRPPGCIQGCALDGHSTLYIYIYLRTTVLKYNIKQCVVLANYYYYDRINAFNVIISESKIRSDCGIDLIASVPRAHIFFYPNTTNNNIPYITYEIVEGNNRSRSRLHKEQALFVSLLSFSRPDRLIV